jgi:hypothetical protein
MSTSVWAARVLSLPAAAAHADAGRDHVHSGCAESLDDGLCDARREESVHSLALNQR